MLSLTQHLIQAGFADRVISEKDIARLLNHATKRYSLHNITHTALAKGELIKLRRGLYVLNEAFRTTKIDQYYLANNIVAHSYVSFETALSYHGWIPERVPVLKCAINSGRARHFETPYGRYEYIKIPTNDYEFLTGVSREQPVSHPCLIASPLRAIADLVYEKKIDWQGLRLLTDSYRIEYDQLQALTDEDFTAILNVFRSKRVIHFLSRLYEVMSWR